MLCISLLFTNIYLDMGRVFMHVSKTSAPECCKINTMKNNQIDGSLGLKRRDFIKGVKQSPFNEKLFEVELII